MTQTIVVDWSIFSGAQQLQKLEKRVQDGDYYEAQQMYKSVHSR